MTNTFFLFFILLLSIVILPLGILFIISIGTLPDIVENDLKEYKGLKGYIKHYFIIDKNNKFIYKIIDATLSILSISYMLFIYFLNKLSIALFLIMLMPMLGLFSLFIALFERKQKAKELKYNY